MPSSCFGLDFRSKRQCPDFRGMKSRKAPGYSLGLRRGNSKGGNLWKGPTTCGIIWHSLNRQCKRHLQEHTIPLDFYRSGLFLK